MEMTGAPRKPVAGSRKVIFDHARHGLDVYGLTLSDKRHYVLEELGIVFRSHILKQA
jgi:hypothetical protein